MRVGIHEEVLGLDVAVAHAQGMDVGEGAEELVGVELDRGHGQGLLGLGVRPEDAVDRLGHVVHHEVEVRVVRLVPLRVEEVVQHRHVVVVQHLHDLQLAVLEPLVLQHLLDGDLLVAVGHRGHVHGAKGARADGALLHEGPATSRHGRAGGGSGRRGVGGCHGSGRGSGGLGGLGGARSPAESLGGRSGRLGLPAARVSPRRGPRASRPRVRGGAP
mmetsp:Transcript_1132/g.3559  ORF Transcript_1132/g.3559 Transcript_1132/m.3559 type:complete len:217 (+) Transcript_1132:706-1356(+)